MKKKTIMVIACACVLILGLVWGIYAMVGKGNGTQQTGGDVQTMYSQSVASIIGMESSLGVTNRYSGVVEAQKSESVNADSERTIQEILVAEGDIVEEGDPLFTYDIEEAELALSQSRLELEKLNNNLQTIREEIKELESERNKAASADKLEYTTQIQSKELDVKQAEYDIKVKEAEIEQKEKTVEDTTVVAPMGGMIQSINKNGSSGDTYSYGDSQDTAFIKILSTGMYRVKCKVSEQNIQDIAQQAPVIVRSRISDTDTWTGIIEEINTGSTESEEENYSSDDPASQYAFYVTLDSSEGLMMGQHVYVEMDLGQYDAMDGIWLSSAYLVQEDEQFFVWADNNGSLEKRAVTVGTYNEDMDQYEILEGLSTEDWIVFADDSLSQGMKVTRQTQYSGMED